MSSVEVPGGLYVPTLLRLQTTTGPTTAFVTITQASSPRTICAVVTVPASGDLNGFQWFCQAFSNTGGNTLWQAFQDIDATGLNDGTSDQFIEANPTGAGWRVLGTPMTSDGTATGTKRTVVEGQQLACVIGLKTGGTASVSWGTQTASSLDTYPFLGSGAAPQAPEILLEYSDSSLRLPVGAWASTLTTTTSVSTSTTPDEMAMVVELAAAASVDGGEVYIDLDANAVDVVLYGSDHVTVLASSTGAQPMRGINTVSLPLRVGWEAVPLTATPDTYLFAVRATSTTAVRLWDYTMPSTTAVDETLGGERHGLLATRSDTGTWTYSTTRRFFAAVRLSDIQQ